jgi:hypothetical protein
MRRKFKMIEIMFKPCCDDCTQIKTYMNENALYNCNGMTVEATVIIGCKHEVVCKKYIEEVIDAESDVRPLLVYDNGVYVGNLDVTDGLYPNAVTEIVTGIINGKTVTVLSVLDMDYGIVITNELVGKLFSVKGDK